MNAAGGAPPEQFEHESVAPQTNVQLSHAHSLRSVFDSPNHLSPPPLPRLLQSKSTGAIPATTTDLQLHALYEDIDMDTLSDLKLHALNKHFEEEPDQDVLFRTLSEANPAFCRKSLTPLGEFRAYVLSSFALDDEEEIMEKRTCLFFPLYPRDKLRRGVDLALLFAIFYTLIFAPLRVAFGPGILMPVDFVVDIIFWVDVALSFVSAYRLVDGQFQHSIRRISWHYLTTWFFLDLIAVFPYYTLENRTNAMQIPSMLRLLRSLRLLKVMRTFSLSYVRRFRTYYMRGIYRHGMTPRILRTGRLLLGILGFGHLSSCLWYFFGNIAFHSNHTDKNNWISQLDEVYEENGAQLFSECSDAHHYWVSLYWSYTTLTSVGYGDITPYTSLEMFWAIVIQISGVSFFVYLLSEFANTVRSRNMDETDLQNRIQLLFKYMRKRNVDTELQGIAVARMVEIWKHSHVKENLPWKSLVKDMDNALLRRLSVQMHRGVMSESKYMRTCFGDSHKERQLWRNIAVEMEPVHYMKGDLIVYEGDPVEFWALIESGEVLVFSQLNPKLRLTDLDRGCSFGEQCIRKNQKWGCSMKATTEVDLVIIPARRFRRILSEYPLTRFRTEYYVDSVKFLHGSTWRQPRSIKPNGRTASLIRRGTWHQGDLSATPNAKLSIERDVVSLSQAQLKAKIATLEAQLHETEVRADLADAKCKQLQIDSVSPTYNEVESKAIG